MPRTKRAKRVRPAKQSELVSTEIDPNIVIKQEPEDPLPDNMEFEAERSDTPDDNFKPPVLATIPVNPATVYSIEQLRKLANDVCKQDKQFFDQKKATISAAINVLKLKIPPEIRNVPIEDVIRKQGLQPSDSNDLLSLSQRIGNNEQTSKTSSSDLQKECTVGNDSEVKSSMNKFKTPALGLPTPRIGTITPKVGPNSPITILRRPKLGEVVVSMKGSPVMLNAAREDKPTLNIPMTSGTVMSILPERGLRTAHLPQDIGAQTLDHLKAIKDNLEGLIVAISETQKP